MTQGIFIIQKDGSMVELHEEAYNSENLLQELLAKFPNILSGNQSEDEKPHRWLLIKREMGIPDGENNGDRWAVDHLFLDQEGIPTLVEVKRSSDTRIRREVVGQMLDYAANAIVYWPIEKIQSAVEETAAHQSSDANAFVQEFIGEEDDLTDFWQNVKTNLTSGRIRMVFIADEIPRELKRIIEFLNQQMDPADVYGIEVRQFTGHGIRTLVPQVVGVTENARIIKDGGISRRQWDKTTFLDVLKQRPNKREFEVAQQILEWVEARKLRLSWGFGVRDGAFYPMLDIGDKSFYTFSVRTSWNNAHIQLQFAYLKKPFDTIEKRRELADLIENATATTIKDENLNKFPGIYLHTLDKAKTGKFLEVFDWYLGQYLKEK